METNISLLQISLFCFVIASFIAWAASSRPSLLRAASISFGLAAVAFAVVCFYAFLTSSSSGYAFLLMSIAFSNLGAAMHQIGKVRDEGVKDLNNSKLAIKDSKFQ